MERRDRQAEAESDARRWLEDHRERGAGLLVTAAHDIYMALFGKWAPGDMACQDAAVYCLRSGTRTAQALGVLLDHSFVVDALGRWRALHEIAATASVLAEEEATWAGPSGSSPSEAYLVHAGIREAPMPAPLSARTLNDYRSRSYAWLDPRITADNKIGSQTTAHLLGRAKLGSSPLFPILHGPANFSAHLASWAVARMRDETESERAEPEALALIRSGTAASLYELVAACCLLFGSHGSERWEDLLGLTATMRLAAQAVIDGSWPDA